jgi:asparagine synthase (glutamine-hydrolysing)
MARESSGPVRTFSIGFDDQAYDEREYARRVAEQYGTEHHELVVRPDAAAVLERLAWFYDEPFADSSAIPTYYVSELARQHVTVALNGDGGDESFGGYRRYAANLAAERFPDLKFLRPVFSWLHDHLPADPRRGLVHKLSRASAMLGDDAQARYLAVISYFNYGQKQRVYSPGMRRQLRPAASRELFGQIWRDNDAPDLADRMLATDVASYLPGDLLVKVDIASMANSLEGRSPLLDHHVMEFAASLPSTWKVRDTTTKYLLKEAGRGWLPDDILDRPKMGFAIPIGSWLRTDLRDMAWDLLTDSTASQRGYFDTAEVRRLLTEHGGGRDHTAQLWALLQLELWHRTWLDRKPTTRPPGLPDTTS